MTDIEVARYGFRTFRTWRHAETQEQKYFRSLYSADVWDNGTMEAKCKREKTDPILSSIGVDHVSPHIDCTCGIYASLTYGSLIHQYREAGIFLAVIAAEGTTIIGSRGFRTQYARIVAWTTAHANYAEIARKQFKDARQFFNKELMAEAYELPLFQKPPDDDSSSRCGVVSWWREGEQP
jgi:hypothetical protein